MGRDIISIKKLKSVPMVQAVTSAQSEYEEHGCAECAAWS